MEFQLQGEREGAHRWDCLQSDDERSCESASIHANPLLLRASVDRYSLSSLLLLTISISNRQPQLHSQRST